MKKLTNVLLCLMLILFLFACGNKSDSLYRDDLLSANLLDTITTAIPSDDGYAAVSGDYISSSTWGENYTNLLDVVSDWRICTAEDTSMNVDELGVFHVKNADNVDAATKIVEAFVEGQALRHKVTLEAYNPEEIPKLDNAQVKVCGNYIFYSILDKDATDTAISTFETALKSAS